VNLRCTLCNQTYPLDTRRWRCECGGAFDVTDLPGFDPAAVDSSAPGLWRYRATMPLPENATPVTLGEVMTPLVETELDGLHFHCKVEYLLPTGSFKDRGTAVMVSALRALGVTELMEDSSGNAGASLAAYTARAGITCTVFVPAHASLAKQGQIAAFGARLVRVPGPRENTTRAVRQEAATGRTYYASHYYNPFGLAGVRTIAYELWEQLDGHAPDNIVLPAGHGTLSLGTYRGFRDLKRAGLISRLPRMFVVQSQACAPLHAAFVQGSAQPVLVEEGTTVAEGIRIARPQHGQEILAAIRETGGQVLAVSDEEILASRDAMSQRGLYIEPTSAVPIASLAHLRSAIGADELTIVPLTGSGFKSPVHQPRFQEMVRDFVTQHGLSHTPATHALDLVSEVGEVSKEVLKATDYEQRPFAPTPELSGELGDVLYALAALADSCGVDLEQSLEEALRRYAARLETTGHAGSAR
jgi:threonine synthase